MFGNILSVLGLSTTAPREHDEESDDSEASVDSYAPTGGQGRGNNLGRPDAENEEYYQAQQSWEEGGERDVEQSSSSSSSSASAWREEVIEIDQSSDEDGKKMIESIAAKKTPMKRKVAASKADSSTSSSRKKPVATPTSLRKTENTSPQNSVGADESGSESESPSPRVVLNVTIKTLSVSGTSSLLSCGKQPPVVLSISLPQSLFSDANTATPSIAVEDFLPAFVDAVAGALDLVADHGVKEGEHSVSSLDFTSMAAIRNQNGAMVALSTLSGEGKYSHSSNNVQFSLVS